MGHTIWAKQIGLLGVCYLLRIIQFCKLPGSQVIIITTDSPVTTKTLPAQITNQIHHFQASPFSFFSMLSDVNYSDALYWDSRYIQEDASFDWYQRYSALRPFIRKHVSPSSRLLMVGCGNSVMSEEMVKDGYQEIMNIDISSVAIDMMRRKYEHTPQLKYLHMDVRDMSFFQDESFDSVIDKGTLDSLMCGADAPISSSRMLGEVSRLLKPGGSYILITYGDPTVRMPHLKRPVYSWKISLYIVPRPGFEWPVGSKSSLEGVALTEEGLLPQGFVLEDPECHYIYVCQKADELASILPAYSLTADLF